MNNSFEIIEGFAPDSSGTCVGWDDYRVGRGKLFTVGIGPCLAIAIYDNKQKKGALAHISGIRERVPRHVHPENIVNSLILGFREYGNNNNNNGNLESFLAGEGYDEHWMSQLVRKYLSLSNIPVVGEDLGRFKNHRGREVHVDCQAGKILVYRYPY